ncbi:MAG: GspE/PulE family protein [Sulfuricurvum sp.]
MDILTTHLLKDGYIMQSQVDRLVSRGLSSKVALRDLVLSGFMTTDRLARYIVERIIAGEYTIDLADEYDFIDKKKVLQELAKRQNIAFLDLDSIDLDFKLSEKVPLNQLKRCGAIPVLEDDLAIMVAIKDPLDIDARENIQRFFPKKPIKIAVATQKQIEAHIYKIEIKDSIKELIKKIRDELNSIASLEEQQQASSILQLIDVILSACIKNRASDVHIEACEKNCKVRARVDGRLAEMFIFDNDIFPPLSSRLKLLANLDIAERRKPQDGRFSSMVGDREFDYRISTLPTLYGESIVMRILDKQKALVKLEEAGMDEANYAKFIKALHVPYGIILVTGPTGSGKTTTLYGALNELRNTEDKVITVEDPVEYRMNLIQQVQVNPKIGLTFAAALRSILRQDPDKIMIGEIRDQETLEIAIKAALTGHLVISTLHTNDSISAITRMSDMGIPEYLISSAVVAIQAQRLVRKICPHCKVETEAPATALGELGDLIPPNSKFYKGSGCKECNMSGYIGREMISEVLSISEEISSLIAKGALIDQIKEQALKEGFVGMLKNGIDKALEGKTSLDEVLKVAR